MTLEQLVQQLNAAHGDALLGAVVYGSTARDPGARRGHDVLVVVRALDVRALQAAGAIAQAWHEAGNAPLLTLTEAEWVSSRDVFAIEHADIAERHRVLHAAPGFAVTRAADVRGADVRHQLEYELLALTLGVRTAIAGAGRDLRAQRAVLAGNATRATALMRAVLRLEGRAVPADAEEACRETEALTGVAATPFVEALRHKRGSGAVVRSELEATLGAFHAGLTALVAWVDSRPAPG